MRFVKSHLSLHDYCEQAMTVLTKFDAINLNFEDVYLVFLKSFFSESHEGSNRDFQGIGG